MSDKKEKAAPVKKGEPVIDRRHNRTVPQGFATRDSKWKDLGGGFLQLKTDARNVVRMVGGKLVNTSRTEVNAHMALMEQRKAALAEALA